MASAQGVILKKKHEIEKMRASGRIVSIILDAVEKLVLEGNSTMDLEIKARSLCSEYHVKPAFLGYHGFPAVLCISVNEEVVHGIPSASRILKNGDIVSIDMGVVLDGFFGDSARTFLVGNTEDSSLSLLLSATKKALDTGIEKMIEGNTLFSISSAIFSVANSAHLGVVRQYCGHGIGRSLHEEPAVFNYVPEGQKDIVLKEGMVLAVEPMFTLGSAETKTLSDGWTVVTKDASLAAHFEHTIAITSSGPEILTISA